MPHLREGNTDLKNRGVKFPATWAKSFVKSHPLVGDLTTPQGRLSAYFMHATCD